MIIKIGDTVKFLNDVGGGRVSKILDKETALILGNDGFEVPALKSELLLVESETAYAPQDDNKISFQEEPEEENEEDIFYTNNPDVNLYLAFVPKNQNEFTDSELEVFLINDSNYFVYYNYAENIGTKHRSINGILEPNTKDILKTIDNKLFNENISIVVQLIFFDKKDYDLREPYSKHLKIRVVKFYKNESYKQNDFFEESALIMTIIEESAMKKALKNLKKSELKKIVIEKENKNKSLNKPKRFRKRINIKIKEVDLHLHELIDDETGLSDYEKLKLQLNVFNKEMNDAIKNKINKIVFIHGVGNGVLKLEVRREMQRNYKRYEFQDASFKKYGYGATMIILR